MGFAPNLRAEVRVYARFILDSYPYARIGLLYQSDESGRDYLTGLKEALGARAGELIVSDASYDGSDPTGDSQVVRLKTAGVDVLINMAASKFAAQVIRKVAELDWKPVHLLGVGFVLDRWGPDPRGHRERKRHHLSELVQGGH